MTFLALIAAVLLHQLWAGDNPTHNDGWFHQLQAQLAGTGLSGPVRLLLVVAGPALIAYGVMGQLQGILFGLPWIAVAAALLLYSFGRGDVKAIAMSYRDFCQQGNFEGARLFLEGTLETAEAENPQEFHTSVQRQLLYRGYQSWFAVLFFFVFLGPAAALAYRLLQFCRGTGDAELAGRVLYYLDWIPARLLAGVFTLTGNFVGSWDEWVSNASDTGCDAASVLYAVGSAAAGTDTPPELADGDDFGQSAAWEARQLWGLLTRSYGAWLAIIALLVLLA